MSEQLTKDELLKARKIADTYAKSLGKNSIEEIVQPIREGMNSDDVTQQELARDLARGTVEQLTKLILRQEIFTIPDAPYMDVVNVFDDGVVKEGNAKLYDFYNPSGHDTFNLSQFVATAHSAPDVNEFTIQMYQANNQLSAQGYQFRKSLVYTDTKWIPYFKMGNLTGFIAMLQSAMTKTWKMYIFDKIIRKITATTTTYKKTIAGTAANCFDAWTNEILPEIRKMTTLSSNYNITTANTNLMSTQPSDLLIFAHPKTIQTLQSGIKSQLFNAQLLDIKGLVDAENFIDCGEKLNIAHDNNDTVITSAVNDYYIDENTIYVISKKAMKHFSQINTIGTQYYPRNMSVEFVMHKWGALDFLPWGQGFKYTNTNLNTLP